MRKFWPVASKFRSRARRFDTGKGERGSMAILMMVVLVGLMLSALLVPMIITQSRTTRFDQTRVQALDAAQAGIDVTLGAIRAAVDPLLGAADGVTWGNSIQLPCTSLVAPFTPLTGLVNANGAGIASYSVFVEYFMFDPVNEPLLPLIPPYYTPPSATNAMNCTTSTGPRDPISAATTPLYARITSTGTVGTAINGSTAGRVLTSTYVFRTANISILGGTIQLIGSNPALCMDVGSKTAPAGTPLVMQACSLSRPPLPQQVFAYRTDLTLQLVVSATLANPAGLCLNSLNTPAKLGEAVILSQCATLNSPPPYTQQWSFNDLGHFQAADAGSADTGVLAPLCMDVTGQAVILSAACGGSGYSWAPSFSVGPGAAGLPEWVSYQEFGRCMDVPGLNVHAPSLMLYPCKQNPYPGALLWNQVFQSPPIPAGQPSATGTLSSIFNRGVPGYPTPDNINYCVTSPINDTATAWVGVSPCPIPPAPAIDLQQWTIYGGDKSLTYSQKFTIVSTKSGLCIAVGPKDNTNPWSGLIAKKCDGGPDQKWNVDPSLLNVTMKNIRER